MWMITFVWLAMMTSQELPALVQMGDEYLRTEAEELGNQTWVGLFGGAGEWSLMPVRLVPGMAMALAPDDAVSYLIESEPKGARWAFPAGVLEARGVVPGARGVHDDPYERPGREFALGERSYTVHVEGFHGADAVRHRVALREGDREQVLFDATSIDDGFVHVLWAGDLDGDGRLDLITDISATFGRHPFTLWLSSKAREGEIVGVAAHAVRYAC